MNDSSDNDAALGRGQDKLIKSDAISLPLQVLAHR